MTTPTRPLLRTAPDDRRRLTRPSAGLQKVLRAPGHLPGIVPIDRYNVTISHSHRLVWFRVAKVGTRSVFAALRDAGVTLDLEEPFGVSAPRLLTPGYRRVAFVRHPVDRFLSGWQSTVLKLNHFGFDDETHRRLRALDGFLEWFAEQDPATCDAHFRLQSTLVPSGRLDLLGRMESFADDLTRLLAMIGAPVGSVPRRNASPSAAPRLTPAQRGLLVERYAPDFERFGFDPGAPA